ncbi:MAG TPA: hypothetical protein VLT13_14470, partial [Bacteroidota bacterium]|nr:hypothetical protein [Bacteroidota bacterium]
SAGSLVRFLSLTVQDTTREYTWRPQLGQHLSRTLYQNFYDRCIAAIQRSLTPTTKPLDLPESEMPCDTL